MALIEINTNPTQRELRQFAGIWFPAFWGVVGGLLWYKAGLGNVAMTLWCLAAVIAIVGLAVPRWMRPVWIGWMVAAFPIGWTVSHLLLAIIFYLCITPIGLAMRLASFDPLERKPDSTVKTYWKPHKTVEDTNRYFQQF